MNVTNIVNEESERKGFLFLFGQGREFGLHVSVDEVALVGAGVGQPVNDLGDGLVHGVGILDETWVIVHTAALVKVGLVNEVPTALPGTTLGFDLICEGCTLYHRIVALETGHIGVSLAIDLQEVRGLG